MKILKKSNKIIKFSNLNYYNNKENIPLINLNPNELLKYKLIKSKELSKNLLKDISNNLTTIISYNNNIKKYSNIIKNNTLQINKTLSSNIYNDSLIIKNKNLNENENINDKKTNKNDPLIFIYNDNNNNLTQKNEIKNENNKKENLINEFISEKENEYFFDIFQHLLSIESDFLPKFDYMNLVQDDINEKMRNILLDWLFELHIKFNLTQETFLLTVNIIDRYLSIKKINRKYLQLLGITSMFISCKYEEIYCPKINDFIYFTDYTYNKNEMLNMENDILNILNFDISFASTLTFLNMYKNSFFKLNENMNCFCNFLINISEIEYNMIKFKPSHIAISIIFISFLQFEKNINDFYLNNFKFKLKDKVIECIQNLIKSWKKNDDDKFQIIIRKYMSEKHYVIGKEKINFETNYLL